MLCMSFYMKRNDVILISLTKRSVALFRAIENRVTVYRRERMWTITHSMKIGSTYLMYAWLASGPYNKGQVHVHPFWLGKINVLKEIIFGKIGLDQVHYMTNLTKGIGPCIIK